MDKAVKLLPNLKSEDFYGDKQSIYLRCTYLPKEQGYKILIYNQMSAEDMDENAVKLAIAVRGLAELALESPEEVFEVGYMATLRDQVDLNEDLNDEEKDLLRNPIGNA